MSLTVPMDPFTSLMSTHRLAESITRAPFDDCGLLQTSTSATPNSSPPPLDTSTRCQYYAGISTSTRHCTALSTHSPPPPTALPTHCPSQETVPYGYSLFIASEHPFPYTTPVCRLEMPCSRSWNHSCRS